MRRLGFVSALLLVTHIAAAKEGVGDAPRFGSSVASWAPHKYASPQRFAFELKFSPYTPHLDSSNGLAAGATPFADLFTNQNDMPRHAPGPKVLTQLEFDYQFFHKFGSLGIGHTIGIYRRTTHAFTQDPANPVSCTVPSCVRSGDETALTIVPLSLLLVYRFDVLANRWRVPLVPYLKTGPAYYMWFVQNGSGGIATAIGADGVKRDGYGGSFGWVFNPGIAFQLDIIDQSVARRMDAEVGINHTYLFCELHYALVNGFGAANKMDLSDLTLNAGLSFEF